MKLVGGPHAARGLRVGQHWSTQYDSSPLGDKNDSTLPPAASFNLFEPATEAEITNLTSLSKKNNVILTQFQRPYLKNAQTFSSQL